MLQLDNIDKTQLSEPVLAFLNEMELKHAKIGYCLTVSAVRSTYKDFYWQLRFHDTRFTTDEIDLVGVVEYTYGSRSDHEYKISSRKIHNGKYSHWSNENHSQRTKDVKKALKIAMGAMQPFEWHEVSNKGRRNAEQAHELWAKSDSSSIRAFRIDPDTLYQEIKYLSKYLKDLGIPFNTDAFKSAAAGIEAYEEFQRKASIKPKFDTVIVREDKVILIPDGRALEPQELGALDTLPENTRNAIALLKLVEKDKLLPEIGYRSGENTYFILT